MGLLVRLQFNICAVKVPSLILHQVQVFFNVILGTPAVWLNYINILHKCIDSSLIQESRSPPQRLKIYSHRV